jgi:O-antigen ligase/tetratricopeptide (TPR) repeat protein
MIVTAIAQIPIGITVLVSPWIFGGVQSSVQVWMCIGVMLSLACCLLLQFRKDAPAVPLPVVMIPIFLAIALGFAQLAPIPQSVLRVVSPTSLKLWTSLTGQGKEATGKNTDKNADAKRPDPVAVDVDAMPANGTPSVSLFPSVTRQSIALMMLAAGGFVVGTSLFSSSKQPVVLLGGLAVLGTALAFFGVAQQLAWNGQMWGSGQLAQNAQPFSTFINRNNAGGFLNLCLAGAAGLAIWSYSRISSRGSVAASRVLSQVSLRERPVLRAALRRLAPLIAFVADFDVIRLFSLAALAMILTGIAFSLSRGTWFACGVAVMISILAIAAARRASTLARVLVPVSLAVVILIAWFGRTELLFERMGRVSTDRLAEDGRWTHWKDGLRSASHFPLLGSGFGTYRYVYPIYREKVQATLSYHAENQYLESLAEGGVVGAGLLVFSLGLIGMACFRLIRESVESTSHAFGVAGLFALTAQSVGGFFDFGLNIPANLLVFALICGAVAGRAASVVRAQVSRHDSIWKKMRRTLLALPRHDVAVSACLAVLFVAIGWGFTVKRAEALADTAMRTASLPTSYTEANVRELNDRIAALGMAIQANGDDAEAQRRLAKLWIHRYRLRALDRMMHQPLEAREPKVLWPYTSPLSLHGWVNQLSNDNRTIDLENLRQTPEVQTDLQNAARHLLFARRACPVLADVHLLLAQIEPAIMEDPSFEPHIQRASQLAQSDPQLLSECGLVELQAGHPLQTVKLWRQVSHLEPARFPGFLRMAIRRPDLRKNLKDLMPDSIEVLVQAAADVTPSEHAQDAVTQLLGRAGRLLDSAKLPAADVHHLRGRILALQKQPEPAIEQYTLAVELNPTATRWRYELASLLLATRKLDEAQEEITQCYHEEPGNKEYEALMKKVIHEKVAGSR